MCTFYLGYGSSLLRETLKKQDFGLEAFDFVGDDVALLIGHINNQSDFKSTSIPSECGHKKVFLYKDDRWPVQGSNL